MCELLAKEMNKFKKSMVTNCWGNAIKKNINTKEEIIYLGQKGHQFSHHPQIMKNHGKLYASWSRGVVDEDNVGQEMVMSISEDNGKTWSNPEVIVDYKIGGYEEGSIITSMGIHAEENTMVAYFGHYYYDENTRNLYNKAGCENLKIKPDIKIESDVYTGIMVSNDFGKVWRGPVEVIKGFVPNMRPQPLKNGRLIMPGQVSFAYTDDPYGIKDWKISGIPNLPYGYIDSPEGFYSASRYRGFNSIFFCESSFYEMHNGTIRMMMRTVSDNKISSKQPGILAITESTDLGQTWSEPELTHYTDVSSRFHFGILSDGRYFGVSCPDPLNGRTPLVLAISNDGTVFDKHYILGNEPEQFPRWKGNFKGGRYGYPSYYISDGTIYIIYSIYKEDIAFCKINLSELN